MCHTLWELYNHSVLKQLLFASGFVVPPSLRTWPPRDPTWLWCSWLMREWPTAASTQHTRLCPYWTVSSCYCKPRSYSIKELLVPFFSLWSFLLPVTTVPFSSLRQILPLFDHFPFFSDLNRLFKTCQFIPDTLLNFIRGPHSFLLAYFYPFPIPLCLRLCSLHCGVLLSVTLSGMFSIFKRDMWSQPVCLQYRGVPSATVAVRRMERLPRWSRRAGLWKLHLPSLQ